MGEGIKEEWAFELDLEIKAKAKGHSPAAVGRVCAEIRCVSTGTMRTQGSRRQGAGREGQPCRQVGPRWRAILNGLLMVWTLASKGELLKDCEQVRDIMSDCER